MTRNTHGLRQRPAAFGLLMSACALLCAPAWPEGPTLTYMQLQRLLKVVDQHGTRTTLPHSVAAILDLNPKQLAPDIKQVAVLDEDGNRHGFAPLNDGSGYFMFRNGTSIGNSVYRVDPTLHLVRAARSLVKNGPLIALPDAGAQKELDEELGRWSKLLSLNAPVTAPAPYPFGRPEGPAVAPAPYPLQPKDPAAAPARPEPSKP